MLFFVVCDLTVSSLIHGYVHVCDIALDICLYIDMLPIILLHCENMKIFRASGDHYDIIYCIMVSWFGLFCCVCILLFFLIGINCFHVWDKFLVILFEL